MTSPSLHPSDPPRRWDVLAFGDPCVDLVFSVDALPAMGDKVLGQPLGTHGGGTEANVACAAARLGAHAALFGRVGEDAHAEMLRQGLSAFGVAIEHLAAHPSAPCACAVTMLSPSGERSIVYLPMPPAEVDAQAMAHAMGQARVAYCMPYGLYAFQALSRAARAAGTLVAIDVEAAVAPDAATLGQRVADADIVFFNESGFKAGTGLTPTQDSMGAVLRAGPRLVVVTLGDQGAMAMDATGCFDAPAMASRVVDTTGAGDTFNAAFLVAWLEGQPLPRALRFANAAASCSVAALGARGGMPSRAQVQSLIDGQP